MEEKVPEVHCKNSKEKENNYLTAGVNLKLVNHPEEKKYVRFTVSAICF